MCDHNEEDTPSPSSSLSSWTCQKCTLVHSGRRTRYFLACEVCSTERPNNDDRQKKESRTTTPAPATPPKQQTVPVSSLPLMKVVSSTAPVTSLKSEQKRPSNTNNSNNAWGSLRPPSEKDIVGPRKRQKVLDAPPPMLDYIIVLDFEWTADDKRRMEPVAEITQFPSVAMRLFPTKEGLPTNATASCISRSNSSATGTTPSGTPSTTSSRIPLPLDLTVPSFEMRTTYDACAVDAFDTFVRPTFNPRLSLFAINLTAITQDQVDTAPTIDVVLQTYINWLHSLQLVDKDGHRIPDCYNWCFATWGDGDIMETLRRELQYKSIRLPPCFDRWINLKSDSIFKKHFGREPRGGLRSCVESIGTKWEGRAHNGLVDSINTAKIVRRMVQTGFRFTKSTRGLAKDGVPFGRRKK